MRTKTVARISKVFLKSILSGKESKKTESNQVQQKAELWNDILSEKSTDIKTESILQYVPPSKKDFMGRHRLNSSEIKLFILLHFICNSKGFGKYVRKRDLANELNLSLKTINRSICGLMEHGFILVGNKTKGYINYGIVNYEKLFEKKKSGGYYTLSRDNFKSLLKMETVNHLRAELFVLYKSDFNTSYDKAVIIDTQTMLSVAPSIAYRKAMKCYSDTASELCDKRVLSTDKTIIRIYPNTKKSGKNVLEEIELRVKSEVFPKLSNLKPQEKEDLVNLGKEYGFDILNDSIYYLESLDILRAPGADLGALIRSHMNTYYQLAL